MIDLESIKTNADLFAVVEHDTSLRRVANTGGGEWAGPCPFCGGHDRFHVQPFANPGRWMCHYCTDSIWQDVLTYIARRDRLDIKQDFTEICKRASGGVFPTSTERHVIQLPVRPAYGPPDDDWQKSAIDVIDQCQDRLWKPIGGKWLQYLHNRGLTDQTIQYFKLGYSNGETINGVFVPVGVVIPCIVGSVVWYLKIRQPVGYTPKYKLVTGSKSAAIYNADNLAPNIALFCEGEFDCMIAHQELFKEIPCATLGSATNNPDQASWGIYFLPLRVILSAYDSDAAGEKGATRLHEIAGQRVKLCPVPNGKDINEFFLAGGDLWKWILPHLELYD